MNILAIYEQYQLPPNLIRHQLEVTAVGRFICDHWTGEPVDRDAIMQALLLHDMGNIIKFRRPFLGELEKDAQKWERVQDAFVRKYGTNVHESTCAILKELGALKALDLVEKMQEGSFSGYENLSWESKICEYADCCVTPKGVEGFEVRLADLMHRYSRTADESWTKTMRDNAISIEGLVNCDLKKLSTIDFTKDIQNVTTSEI